MLDELADDLQHLNSTATYESNAAGDCLRSFGPPATVHFDSASPLLQDSFSGSNSCLIAVVMPASPVAMPGLEDKSTEGDLPLAMWGAVADAL